MNYGAKYSSCKFPHLQGSHLPLRTDLANVRLCWSFTAALGNPCEFKLGFGGGREEAAPRDSERVVQYNVLEQCFHGIVLEKQCSDILQLYFDDWSPLSRSLVVETSHQKFGWSSCGLGKLLLEKLGSACSEAQADTDYSRGSFWQEIGTMLEKKQCRP